MKWWNSVSTRLNVILLALTLSSFAGFSLAIDAVLKDFFIRDALATLRRHSDVFATQAQSEWNKQKTLEQWTELLAQQGQWQVIVFDAKGKQRITSEGVPQTNSPQLAAKIVSQTLLGIPQQGRFRVTNNSQYLWWLYSTAPIRQGSDIVGLVYVSMPMRRPRQFAQQVQGVIVGMVLLVTSITVVVGFLLSRSFTRPLKRLHQQAQLLGTGDYTARSDIKGHGELAHLSHSLDDMATKLATSLEALKAQENARRELVANVSHDLRTPLASLRVELEAVLDGVVEGEKAQQYLRRACRETDYLARLVEQLLLLARADAGQLQVHPQAVSVVAIAQECLSRMETTAMQSELYLELQAAKDIPQVWIDPELTGQMVINLLDNAIKYAPQSQVISLEVLPVVEEEKKFYVPLQVRDRGPGMEAEILHKVTQRFYRGSSARPRGGLGLGLAIAHQVCQIQGGSLQIDSKPNRGTVVRLLLPTKPL